MSAPVGTVYALRDALEKQRAIRQSREIVVVREVIEPFRLSYMIQREGDVASEFLEQPHFFLIEDIRFVGK